MIPHEAPARWAEIKKWYRPEDLVIALDEKGNRAGEWMIPTVRKSDARIIYAHVRLIDLADYVGRLLPHLDTADKDAAVHWQYECYERVDT